jgi:2',3'-cyclic-nucleotide 2'-phosphodiesterase (5'-nucleotidase family)
MQRAGLVLMLWLCAAPLWAADTLTLIYSSNLDGELEPCGCSAEGNLGGIKRRATLLAQLREAQPGLVAISAGGLLSSDGPGDRLKGEYILKGFAAFDYDAVGVQWRDLAYGADFALQAPLPWVISNWQGDAVPAQRIIERGGQRIAFFNWLDPTAAPQKDMQGEHQLVTASPAALQAALSTARQQGMLTVLATTLNAEQAAATVGLEAVDILIQRAAYEEYSEPRQQGTTLVLQAGSRGMRLGRLDLSLQAGRIKQWTHQVLPMPNTIADAPQLADWYEAYNAEVKAEYLRRVELRKQQKAGESPYVGEEACATCHQEQHRIWFDSQHAIAYEDLEGVNKAFDPQCIKCHVVGFEQPGGFFDINITAHLMGVQCESCHGAGREHVEQAGRTPLPNSDWPREKICAQCHVQKHSPSFDFSRYWPKIAH